MWLYFNENGNITTCIPHGQPVRQNNSFDLYICFPYSDTNKKWLNLNPIVSFDKNNSNSFEIAGIPDIGGIWGSIITFERNYISEVIYDFKPGQKYVCYRWKVASDYGVTANFGNLPFVVSVTLKDNVARTGRATINVLKTYGNDNITTLGSSEYDNIIKIIKKYSLMLSFPMEPIDETAEIPSDSPIYLYSWSGLGFLKGAVTMKTDATNNDGFVKVAKLTGSQCVLKAPATVFGIITDVAEGGDKSRIGTDVQLRLSYDDISANKGFVSSNIDASWETVNALSKVELDSNPELINTPFTKWFGNTIGIGTYIMLSYSSSIENMQLQDYTNYTVVLNGQVYLLLAKVASYYNETTQKVYQLYSYQQYVAETEMADDSIYLSVQIGYQTDDSDVSIKNIVEIGDTIAFNGSCIIDSSLLQFVDENNEPIDYTLIKGCSSHSSISYSNEISEPIITLSIVDDEGNAVTSGEEGFIKIDIIEPTISVAIEGPQIPNVSSGASNEYTFQFKQGETSLGSPSISVYNGQRGNTVTTVTANATEVPSTSSTSARVSTTTDPLTGDISLAFNFGIPRQNIVIKQYSILYSELKNINTYGGSKEGWQAIVPDLEDSRYVLNVTAYYPNSEAAAVPVILVPDSTEMKTIYYRLFRYRITNNTTSPQIEEVASTNTVVITYISLNDNSNT